MGGVLNRDVRCPFQVGGSVLRCADILLKAQGVHGDRGGGIGTRDGGVPNRGQGTLGEVERLIDPEVQGQRNTTGGVGDRGRGKVWQRGRGGDPSDHCRQQANKS